MADDKRRDERDVCRIDAFIVVSDAQTIPCVVIDISERGARLELDPEADIPESFSLELPVVDGVSDDRPAELRWREGREAGVQFIG